MKVSVNMKPTDVKVLYYSNGDDFKRENAIVHLIMVRNTKFRIVLDFNENDMILQVIDDDIFDIFDLGEHINLLKLVNTIDKISLHGYDSYVNDMIYRNK